MTADAPHERLARDGYVVLRASFDPLPLVRELDGIALDAFNQTEARAPMTAAPQQGVASFRYVPMMCERTPVSLALIDWYAAVAADLLGRAVVPGRAKGTWYEGDTAWHRDSVLDLPTVGVLAYLEPLDAASGALRVVPGSHADPNCERPDHPEAGEVLATVPGDVIVLDERLIHASRGGSTRRQWRVDFVPDPRDEREHAAVAAFFDQCIPDERGDPGYDALRYPSYGPYWRARERPWTGRLDELGAYRRANGGGR